MQTGAQFPTTPIDAGKKRDLYATTNAAGEKDHDGLESALAEVDGMAAKHLGTLLDGGTLSIEARAELSYFLAIQFIRVPSYVETYGISMFQYADRFAGILPSMKWTMYNATEDHPFVTSDNPFCMCDPSFNPNAPFGSGFLTKTMEISLALSRNKALLMRWVGNGDRSLDASEKTVNEINFRAILAADRFVYSPVVSTLIPLMILKANHLKLNPIWECNEVVFVDGEMVRSSLP